MSFNAIDKRASASIVKLAGDPVLYHSHTGTVTAINAVIEENVQIFTGVTESGVSEFKTRISFIRSDAPHWKRNDRIVTEDNRSFLIQDELDDSDDVVVVVTAK